MANPTPEERAANIIESWGERHPARTRRLAREIREAEAAARSKAFEEAERTCRAIRDNLRELAQQLGSKAIGNEASGADTCMREIIKLAEPIRARAKEEPRG